MSTGLAFNLTGANAYSVVSKDIPTPESHEVVIKVHAAGIAVVDAALAKGYFPHEAFFKEYPTVLGLDAAGEVHAVGSDVKNVKVGDRVFKSGEYGERTGGYQQYVTADATFLSKIPDSISYDEAATFPLNLATAANAFYAEVVFGDRTGAGLTAPWLEGGKDKYKGQPTLITNGPSSVGQFAIQLAKLSGFSPIITTASSKHNALLKSLGADVIIDRNESWADIVKKSKEAANGAPFKFIFDIVSNEESQPAVIDLIAPGGDVSLARGPAISKDKYSKDVKVHEIWGSFSAPGTKDYGAKGFAAFPAYLAAGELKPNPVEVIPGGLNGITAGFDRVLGGQVSGAKLVVRPFETTK